MCPRRVTRPTNYQCGRPMAVVRTSTMRDQIIRVRECPLGHQSETVETDSDLARRQQRLRPLQAALFAMRTLRTADWRPVGTTDPAMDLAADSDIHAGPVGPVPIRASDPKLQRWRNFLACPQLCDSPWLPPAPTRWGVRVRSRGDAGRAPWNAGDYGSYEAAIARCVELVDNVLAELNAPPSPPRNSDDLFAVFRRYGWEPHVYVMTPSDVYDVPPEYRFLVSEYARQACERLCNAA